MRLAKSHQRLKFLCLALTIGFSWVDAASAERSLEIAMLRTQIKPVGSTVRDYQERYAQKVAELAGPSQAKSHAPAERLKAFEQAVAREDTVLADICHGLKEALAKHGVLTVEENPSIVLEVKIVSWGSDSSLPVPESNPPPGLVTVTCKQAGRELFTTTFQRSTWGFTKKPYEIGASLGRKTAKKLTKLVEDGRVKSNLN